MNIGKHLKKLRVEKGLSIRDISKSVDLSPAAWSNIERDVNSPTLATLSKICDALGVHLVDLLQQCENESNKEEIVFRKDDRNQIIISGKSNIKYELASVSSNEFQILIVKMEKKCEFGYLSNEYPYDEIALVIKGRMELSLDDTIYILDEGDSIYLKSGSKYQYRNPDNASCEVIWAIQGAPKHSNE